MIYELQTAMYQNIVKNFLTLIKGVGHIYWFNWSVIIPFHKSRLHFQENYAQEADGYIKFIFDSNNFLNITMTHTFIPLIMNIDCKDLSVSYLHSHLHQISVC